MPSTALRLGVIATGVALTTLAGRAEPPGPPQAGAGKSASAPQEHRTAKVSCRAASDRRLENVHLEVAAGDAITAEGGCTLVIRVSSIQQILGRMCAGTSLRIVASTKRRKSMSLKRPA